MQRKCSIISCFNQLSVSLFPCFSSHGLFFCLSLNPYPFFIDFSLNIKREIVIEFSCSLCYIRHRKSTHSKVDAPEKSENVLKDTASLWIRQRGIFISSCSSYRDKQETQQSGCQRSLTMSVFQWKLRQSQMLSYHAPPFLCTPSKLGHPAREAATLSWVLS